MSSPGMLDLLDVLPGDLGDVQGLRLKAAQLDRLAARLTRVDRELLRAAGSTPTYTGPAAHAFQESMRARHHQVGSAVEQLGALQRRLARAASMIDSVEAEVSGVRRRLEREGDSLGDAALGLVQDVQRAAAALGRL